MCYYELPPVQREIGYHPAPYIAAVTRRRLASYGPAIRAGEAAVTAPEERGAGEEGAREEGAGEVGAGEEGLGEEGAREEGLGEVGRRGRGPGGRGPGGGRGHGTVSTPAGLSTQADVTGDLNLECGVVIVGSGAGGATVAAELAEAGVDVVVLEEGGYHPTESFRPETGRALRTLYRNGGGGATIGRPSVLFAEGRCVGGSTVVNGGMSWRTPARVLGLRRARRHRPGRAGLDPFLPWTPQGRARRRPASDQRQGPGP